MALYLATLGWGGWWLAGRPVQAEDGEGSVASPADLLGARIRVPAIPEPAGAQRRLTLVMRAAANCPEPASAEARAKELASQGIGRVILQFKQDETDEYRGGEVFYPSTIAPTVPEFQDGRLLTFADRLVENGIEVCAWLPTFYDPTAAAAHPEWRARTIGNQGTVEAQSEWLCPRNPEALAYEAALVGEAVRVAGNRINGVFVDFFRYDNDLSCACKSCLEAVAKKAGQKKVTAQEIEIALQNQSALWRKWTEVRGSAIQAAADTVRDEIEAVRPDLWLGVFVLPFSAKEYRLNTQSGQDLKKLCRAGVDEIVLMGYWDDWALSPEWLRESLAAARINTAGEAEVNCVLDGDMTPQRTIATLVALKETLPEPWYFHYGEWAPGILRVLRHSEKRSADGVAIAAPETAVVVRIDTEPDSAASYASIRPAMIETLTAMFEEEGILATFVTCGRLAELQPDSIRNAAALGHEIAVHAYDHEQIDSLAEPEQILAVDRGVAAIRRLGVKVSGFGAPRNSITETSRDRLVQHGLIYDGSASYDPLGSGEIRKF